MLDLKLTFDCFYYERSTLGALLTAPARTTNDSIGWGTADNVSQRMTSVSSESELDRRRNDQPLKWNQ